MWPTMRFASIYGKVIGGTMRSFIVFDHQEAIWLRYGCAGSSRQRLGRIAVLQLLQLGTGVACLVTRPSSGLLLPRFPCGHHLCWNLSTGWWYNSLPVTTERSFSRRFQLALWSCRHPIESNKSTPSFQQRRSF
jgi:hypothetical protein